jgi:transcriptional regulator with XRE-family HTH domain
MVSKRETPLQIRLKKKITEAGLSAHALEKQAGLRRSAVQNILYGKSKKPSAEILGAITKILGCSINELLGTSEENPTVGIYTQSQNDDGIAILDTSLYAKAVQHANLLFKSNQLAPNKQDALNYINEIYQYSLNSNKNDIDITFAEWLAKKTWPYIA